VTDSSPPPGGPPGLVVRLDVRDWRCLVVGGGTVATRRATRLITAGARVRVVAPLIDDRLRARAAEVIERGYRPDDLDGIRLVVTATGDSKVDAAVVADARAAGIPVNDATDAGRGTVVFPAVTTEGRVTMSVDTSGRSPALTAWLRDRLATEVGTLDTTAELMGAARDRMRIAGRSSEHPGWRRALDGGLVELVRAGDLDGARALLHRELGLDRDDPAS
jgi:siroheme synthase-like protein